MAAMLLPPQRNAVATQFAGVVAGVQVDVRMPVGQVVDAVRNELALPRSVKVVVIGLDRPLGERRAGPVEISQQFLLFRVDADDRIARIEIFPPQPRNVLKLCVAVGMMAHRFLFPRGAPSQSELTQQAANGPATGGRARRGQPPRQFPQRQISPQNTGPHWIARRKLL